MLLVQNAVSGPAYTLLACPLISTAVLLRLVKGFALVLSVTGIPII